MINSRAVREVLKVMVSLEEIRKLISGNGFVIIKESKEDSETALVFAERP